MKIKLKDILTPEARDKKMYACAPSIDVTDALLDFLDDDFVSSDGDTNNHTVVFGHEGKCYMAEQERYELAGYDSWGENYNSNKEFELEVTEVKRVEIIVTAWEEV